MKTHDEIKKGLEFCKYKMGDCKGCPYEYNPLCIDDLEFDALAYIQQLEERIAQAERDAKEMANDLDCSACTWCEYKNFDYTNEACKECRTYNEGFKLRGVCERNTKDGANV